LINLKHPIYVTESNNWDKYRLTYAGGRDFVTKYLKQYSIREDKTEFEERRELTYCPNFAGQAIKEIKNSIFSRMPDVRRVNKSESYKQALVGNFGGVDYFGGSIDNFVGTKLLPELLVLGKVGVYVDMPRNTPTTLNNNGKTHPYYYMYRAEDILTWTSGPPDSGHQFVKVLLHDNYFIKDPDYDLIIGEGTRFRLLEVLDSGGVGVTFFNESGVEEEKFVLNIPRIPFVLFELEYSLLQDAADYQIALLNLESTDINFARKANFPVYTEQSSYVTALSAMQPMGQDTITTAEDGTQTVTGVSDSQSSVQKIQMGPTTGRRYFKGLDRPGYIYPSPEPLKVSMEKENQIKRDIRLLVHLATAGLGNKSVSAESKQFDKESLESGLSLIALILEEGERKLAVHWNNYESIKDTPVISYPRHFNLRTDVERRAEAKELGDLSHSIPSQTFQREMMKRIVNILVGGQIRVELLDEMNKEIDSAKSITSDPATIINDFEAGFVTADTASQIRGYPEGEVEQAKKEHEARLRTISQAQGGVGGNARGVSDTQIGQNSSVSEKQGKPGRGPDKQQRTK